MLKKLLLIAFVIAAIAGCAREEQQAEMDTPAATTVGVEAVQLCKHQEGTCTCKGHEGEPCPRRGEEMMCTCASCGHEWKCDGHEGEACHKTEDGCVCKCPECGAECKCEGGRRCATGEGCKGECGAGCTCEGHEGEACPGGDACTCKHHSHGDEHSAADKPGCGEKVGCPYATTGNPGCGRSGSCKANSGS
ncbi:MAG: hypothetical protein ABIJ00_01880 [Candidatus Eisenbacteria bacterium]